MKTILIIEDDEALGEQVAGHLKNAGFSTVWWRKGRFIDSSDYREIAMVILDLMLPGVMGLDILRQLRKDSDVPVLVLSAKQDSSDKVRALKSGADDYLTKPFWPEELIQRVMARLRRPAMERGAKLEIGSLVINMEKREALYEGFPLDLTRLELELLLALARREGKPVSREWLMNNVLDPEKEAMDRTLDVHISRLRKKLGNPQLIETVWGIGYRISGSSL